MINFYIKVFILYCFSSFFTLTYAGCGVFTDDGDYCTDVKSLYEKDMVKGYPDGSYGFSKEINRAELTKLVVLSTLPDGNNLSKYKQACFNDIKKEDWFSEFVCYAKEKNIVEGKNDGFFHPEQTINYAEAAKIIIESLSLGNEDWGSGSIWYEKYVEYMDNLLKIKKAASESIDRGFFAFMLNTSLKEIPPNNHLITTQWDQYSTNVEGYGEMLPGCTAVAVGQLINYYFQQGYRTGWLEQMLQGITIYPRFTDSNGILRRIPYTDVNFLTETSYPTGESDQTRRFLFAVGVGLDSDFRNGQAFVGSYENEEPYESVNGYGSKLTSLLKDRFRFKDIIDYKYIENISDEEKYIINSINNRQPVLIVLVRDGAAHIGIIDQYRIDNGVFQVRINFGWGENKLNDKWFNSSSDIRVSDSKSYTRFIIFKDAVPINYP